MGWAVAGAVVIPFMSILGDVLNWRAIYGGLAVGSRTLAAAGVYLVLPARNCTLRACR
jgi:predicted MFS family arabinose efflux permease